ncbi:acyl-homoserine-lactone synthase [Bradyrhizobium arachidis]|uniref:acyl-homoserine-lactone synthase n=2 Tax=Nitrobacteraceae TaxID=41294 RepID=UPI003D3173D0
MHQLRYRVFKGRLDWDVHTSGDMEIDEFDALHPAYLVQLSNEGKVQGTVRLLPTSGPTMLRDTFPALNRGQKPPSDSRVGN